MFRVGIGLQAGAACRGLAVPDLEVMELGAVQHSTELATGLLPGPYS